jgi:hypothetical protein
MTKLRKKSFVIPSEVRSRAWLGEASEESAVLCYSSHRINNIVQESPPWGLDRFWQNSKTVFLRLNSHLLTKDEAAQPVAQLLDLPRSQLGIAPMGRKKNRMNRNSSDPRAIFVP